MSDVGDIPIKIDLFGIGTIKGIIIRHLAPISADAILKKMPFILRGRFSFGSKYYWTLPGLGIFKGLHTKSTNQVDKGDIVYNPKTDELIIVLENFQLPNKVNKIGIIKENLEFLFKATNGLNTKLSRG